MTDDVGRFLDDPLTYVLLLVVVVIVAATVLGLAGTVLRLLITLVTRRGTLREIRTTWGSRTTISQALAAAGVAPALKEALDQQLRAAGATDQDVPSTQPAAERIAALDALHAQGRISGEKLAELKAVIDAES